MNLFNAATTILCVLYFFAILERLTMPVIYEDAKPTALDNSAEMEWLDTRDYYIAADHGFGCESSWDF